MAEFKRNKKNSFWSSPLALLALFVIVVIFAYNITDLVKKNHETIKKNDLIIAEIDALKKKESDLQKEIDGIKTEQGIEEAIREKYQVVKNGEKMVMIVDEEKSKTETTVPQSKTSFWRWVKGLFK